MAVVIKDKVRPEMTESTQQSGQFNLQSLVEAQQTLAVAVDKERMAAKKCDRWLSMAYLLAFLYGTTMYKNNPLGGGIALWLIAMPIGRIVRGIALRKYQSEVDQARKNTSTFVAEESTSPTASTKEREAVIKGDEGENAVSRELKWLPESFYIINDIVIPNGGKGTQIDHVVVGPGGVFCIETKNWSGNYYPHKNGWMRYDHTNSSGRGRIVDSPQNQSIYHADQLEKLLRSKGYYFAIKPLVVMTDFHGKWKGDYGTGLCPVLYARDLRNYIIRNSSKPQCNDDTLKKVVSLIIAHAL